MLKKKIGYLFFILFLFITVFIFVNSIRDAAQSSSQSHVVVKVTKAIIKTVKPDKEIDNDILTHFVRKLAHYTEFFFQSAALGGFIYCITKRFNVIYILFSGLFTACCDELIQLFSDGRSAQVSDIFIDFSGCVTAALIYSSIYFLVRIKVKERG